MNRYAPDLPEPEAEHDAKALANIREYGWTWFRVHEEEGDADPNDPALGYEFSYTAGLSLTLSHPEIVLVGPWSAAHAITSAAVRLIESGVRFSPGHQASAVLPELPVRFGPVTRQAAKSLLTYADWVNQRRPFDALQLILPDPAGRWPEEDGYVSFPQPSLG